MTPGLSHALIALAIQAAVAALASLLLRNGVLGFGVGAAVALGFYLGRERRQSEEWFGSNRIAPWRWRPRALRDLAWPALAVSLAAGAAFLLLRGMG